MWRLDGLKGRRSYGFDRAALRREILRGLGVLAWAARSHPRSIVVPAYGCLEEELAAARCRTPIDHGRPYSLWVDWLGAIESKGQLDRPL